VCWLFGLFHASGGHTRGRQGRVPEELVQVRLVEPALVCAEEASGNELGQVALDRALGETKVRRQRGQRREALAPGSGVVCQPCPQELGTVGDQATGEQGVGDEDAGVENPAWDENLADLESRSRLALAARRTWGYTLVVSVAHWRMHSESLSETRRCNGGSRRFQD
jgi:hypothetical protein